MNKYFSISQRVVALAIASAFIAAPAFAKDNEGKHEGKAEKHAQKQYEKAEKHAEKAERKADKRQREEIKRGAYFNDDQRTYVRQYYTQQYGDGRRCPRALRRRTTAACPRARSATGPSVNQYHAA